MKPKQYHHLKGNDLTPSEKAERKVVELLLQSNLSDDKRDSSLVFELKHSSECALMARILAQKRKLNLEVAETAAVLHDIYVVVNGSYKDHAKLGGPIAKKILQGVGGFSESEVKIICDAIIHHSEKDIYSDNPYIELVKDVDVFVCSLFRNAEAGYRFIKSEPLFRDYAKRVKKVRRELGLPEKPVFRE